MIPATVQIGKTKYKTALWHKDGSYIVPIKASVRKAEKLEKGDTVTVRLQVRRTMREHVISTSVLVSVREAGNLNPSLGRITALFCSPYLCFSALHRVLK